MTSLECLLAASEDALHGKRMKPAAARYHIEMEKEVFALHGELSSGSYRHGPYHYFMIREPKLRRVAAACFRDRVMHHALVRVLEPLFEPRFIEDSFACCPGKGTHAGMRRAAEFAQCFPFALKCDVKKYFPSIQQGSHTDSVRRVWSEGGGLFDMKEELYDLPIGNLTSQFLANVYLNDLDHFVKHELRVEGVIPSRQCQDRDYPFLQRAVSHDGRRRTNRPAVVRSVSERRGWLFLGKRGGIFLTRHAQR